MQSLSTAYMGLRNRLDVGIQFYMINWRKWVSNSLIEIPVSTYILDGKESHLKLGVNVDDIILATKDPELIQQVKDDWQGVSISEILGSKITFLWTYKLPKIMDHSGLVNATKMVEDKSIGTPIDSGVKLTKANEDCEPPDTSLYQSAIGSLLYFATKPTRHL